MASILYLEDEDWQIDGSLLTVLRDEFHHKVMMCTSVAKARELIRSTRYDAFVVDIMMDPLIPVSYPETPFPLLEEILAGAFVQAGNRADLPIIIVSGVLDMEMRWKDGEA